MLVVGQGIHNSPIQLANTDQNAIEPSLSEAFTVVDNE